MIVESMILTPSDISEDSCACWHVIRHLCTVQPLHDIYTSVELVCESCHFN